METNFNPYWKEEIFKKHPDPSYVNNAKERVWAAVQIALAEERNKEQQRQKRRARVAIIAMAACCIIMAGIIIRYAVQGHTKENTSVQVAIVKNDHGLPAEINEDTLSTKISSLPAVKKVVYSGGAKRSDTAITLLSPIKSPRHESLQKTILTRKLDNYLQTYNDPNIRLVALRDTNIIKPPVAQRNHADTVLRKRITDNDIFYILQVRADHKPIKKRITKNNTDTLNMPILINKTTDSNPSLNN